MAQILYGRGIIPCSGIDTDAMWGFSHTKRWIFGYKLHLISSTGGSIIVPLAADFTTANIPDNQMYSILTASIPFRIIKRILYMSADPGYDDHELYDLSKDMGFQLLCPVKRYENTSADRIKLIEFYESEVGQTIYSLRSISLPIYKLPQKKHIYKPNTVMPINYTLEKLKKITFEFLKSHLWGAADILRGALDASEYRQPIMTILFLKRLNDTFEENSERLEKKKEKVTKKPGKIDIDIPFLFQKMQDGLFCLQQQKTLEKRLTMFADS